MALLPFNVMYLDMSDFAVVHEYRLGIPTIQESVNELNEHACIQPLQSGVY